MTHPLLMAQHFLKRSNIICDDGDAANQVVLDQIFLIEALTEDGETTAIGIDIRYQYTKGAEPEYVAMDDLSAQKGCDVNSVSLSSSDKGEKTIVTYTYPIGRKDSEQATGCWLR